MLGVLGSSATPMNWVIWRLPLRSLQRGLWPGESSRQMPPSLPSSSLPLASKAAAWWSACGPSLPALLSMRDQVWPPSVDLYTPLFGDPVDTKVFGSTVNWPTAAYNVCELEGSATRSVKASVVLIAVVVSVQVAPPSLDFQIPVLPVRPLTP